jgi:hypothetical protein
MNSSRNNHTTTDLTRAGCLTAAQHTMGRVLRVGRATALVLAAPMVAAATTPVITESGKFFPGDVTTSFGRSVAVWGDTAVVGDPDNDLDGNNAGAAWVFVRSGSDWVEQTRLIPSGAAANDLFGTSVDIYEDYIVVGSPYADGANDVGAGSAYVFRRDGATWIEMAELVGAATVVGDPWDSPGWGDRFGHSVAINGDVPADATNGEIWHNIFVGSPDDDHSQCLGAGSAYGFQLSPDGSAWIPMGKIYSNSPVQYDSFGISVDLDGDHMIVGAHKDGDDLLGSDSNPGVVYIWVRRGMLGMWSLETRLNAADPGVNDHFGVSVAVNAVGGLATFVVGAPNDDDLGSDSGSVYIFRGSASTFPQLPKLVASDGSTPDWFGWSVAVNNDLMLIGAPQVGDQFDGAVYVFARQGTSWAESHRLTASDSTALSDYLGRSVALTGDLALAGATGANGSVSYGGAVYEFEDLIEDLFSDGFESGNTSAWSSTSP